MGWARVAATNEMHQPLVGVTIEAFDLDNPHKAVQTVGTDTGGIAIFNGLPSNLRYFFKPRITRHSGMYGGLSAGANPQMIGSGSLPITKESGGGRDQYGRVNLQLLDWSGSTCYDAVVDGSGAKQGSHETIQAAVDQFATGDVGGARPAFIAVKPKGDDVLAQYNETVTFTSTRRYVLHGCAHVNAWFGSEFSGATGTLQAAVRVEGVGTGTFLSTGAGTGQLEVQGFELQGDGNYTVDISSMKIKFINCIINQGAIAAVRTGLSSSFYFQQTQIGESVTGKSIEAVLGSSFAATDSLFMGWVDATMQGGSRMTACVVRASNSGAGTAAVVIGNANTATSWRMVNCYIHQANASGNGIIVNGAIGTDDNGTIVLGNFIKGNGGGTGILFEGSVEGGTVAGNLLLDWGTGVDAGGAVDVVVLGNSYPGTTTATTGGGGSGTVLELTGVAKVSAPFVTVGNDADLTAERALTAGDSIVVTDDGANSTVTVRLAPDVGIDETLALQGDISPAQITADQNNYNPTSLADAAVLRLSSDAARSITGLAGGADGRIVIVLNVGAFDLTLVDESASSTAGNRFALSADVALAADSGIILIYDSTSSRWRALGGTGGGAGNFVLPFLADGDTHEWTNMPAALTEFLGVTSHRTKADLTEVEEVRLVVNVQTAGVAGAKLRVQYSTDESTWNYLDGGTGPSVAIDATGVEVSSYVALAAGAKADVFLRLVGIDGNGVVDPIFGNIMLEGQLVSGAAPIISANISTRTIGITIDGGGSAITTGVKGYIEVPFAATITGWTLLADVSGSIVIDVWKDTYANFPPTVADTIAGTEKPTLASVQKNQDLALSTWTTAVASGDILGFNVDSAGTVTRVTLIIRMTVT